MRLIDENDPRFNLNHTMKIRRSTSDRDDSRNGASSEPFIAIISPSNGWDSFSFFTKIVLRGGRTVRDLLPNSPCLENHFARRFFLCNVNSFPLHFNASISTLIKGERRITFLNTNIRLRKFGMKSHESDD